MMEMNLPGLALLADFRAWSATDTCAWLGRRDGLRTYRAGWDDLARHRERFGLSEVWVGDVSALQSPRADLEGLAQRLIESAEGPFLAFPVATPATAGSLLTWWTAGAAGVRIAPGAWLGQGASPSAWQELAHDAAACGLTVQIVVRLEDPRCRPAELPWQDLDPIQVAALCRAAGPGTVVSGLSFAEASELLQHGVPDDTFCDLWHVNGPTRVVTLAAERGLASHLCFSTGFPLQAPSATALQIAAADLDEAARHAMLKGSARRALSRRKGDLHALPVHGGGHRPSLRQ